MRAIVVLLIWTRMKQSEISSFAMNVVAKMTGNILFPNPAVKLDDLQKSALEFAEKFGNRKNGKNARAELKLAKANLFLLLKSQADYINGIVKEQTDPLVRDEMITSAGMVSTKGSASKSTVPEQPKVPKVGYANGEVRLNVPAVKGASSYLWVIFFGAPFGITVTNGQIEIDQKAKYIMIPVGKAREVVSNVAVGADITVQVLAQNAAGKSSFSPAVAFHTGG